MPRNGSGIFALAEPEFEPGTTIQSTPMNNDLSDIADQITNSVAADGQTAMTGNLNLNGHAIAGATNITASGTVAAAVLTVSGAAATGAQTVTGAIVATGSIAAGAGVSGTTGTFTGAVATGAQTVTGAINATGTIGATGGVISAASIVTSASGWSLTPTGTAAFSGSIGYAFLANGANMLAANYYAASDGRLKFRVADIDAAEALAWLRGSRPVTYFKRPRPDSPDDKAIYEAGFIAQEQGRLSGIAPLIGLAPMPGLKRQIDPDGSYSPDDAMLTLSPGYQIAYLTAAVKSLLARVETLEARCGEARGE